MVLRLLGSAATLPASVSWLRPASETSAQSLTASCCLLSGNVQELNHTGTALEAMETSHTSLGATTKQYNTQAASLSQSHRLLGKMRWHNVLDWLVLWGGVAFFALVVLYILQKRLIYFVPSALTPRCAPLSIPCRVFAASMALNLTQNGLAQAHHGNLGLAQGAARARHGKILTGLAALTIVAVTIGGVHMRLSLHPPCMLRTLQRQAPCLTSSSRHMIHTPIRGWMMCRHSHTRYYSA